MAVSAQDLQRRAKAEEAAVVARKRMASTLSHVMAHFRVKTKTLADTLGVANSTVRNKVLGNTSILSHEVEWFSVVLGVPVDVLYMSPVDAVAWLEEHRPDRRAPLTRANGGYFATLAA